MLERIFRPEETLLARLKPEMVEFYGKLKLNTEYVEAQIDSRIAKRTERRELGKQSARNRLSISLLANKCDRSIGFEWASYPAEEVAPNEQTRREWERAAVIGDRIHGLWQKTLTESFVIGEQDTEVVLETIAIGGEVSLQETGLTGRVDGVWPNNKGKPSLIEIKSVATKNFDPELPWFEDQLKLSQSAMYLHFAGFEKTRFIVVRREADNVFEPENVMEFDYTPNDRFQQALLSRVAYIKAGVADSREAKLLANPGQRNNNCRFCGFRKSCDAYQGLNYV